MGAAESNDFAVKNAGFLTKIFVFLRKIFVFLRKIFGFLTKIFRFLSNNSEFLSKEMRVLTGKTALPVPEAGLWSVCGVPYPMNLVAADVNPLQLVPGNSQMDCRSQGRERERRRWTAKNGRLGGSHGLGGKGNQP